MSHDDHEAPPVETGPHEVRHDLVGDFHSDPEHIDHDLAEVEGGQEKQIDEEVAG